MSGEALGEVPVNQLSGSELAIANSISTNITSEKCVDNLLVDHLDVWSTAVKPKGSAGRGVSKKFELYGIKKLRELILELAVRGKLVPQDPNEEPASVLLEKIASEKSRLIDEARIPKQKILRPVDEDEKPFDIPAGWEWCRLIDLAFPQAGFAFKSNAFNDKKLGIPLVRIRDVGQPFTGTYYEGEYREEFLVNNGDYLISMDGEFRVAAWENGGALLNQRVSRLLFYGEENNSKFIAISLQARLRELQGIKAYTTVDHLSGGQIASSVIGVPPLAEQHRIVTKVNELMSLCDQLEQNTEASLDAHTRLVDTLLKALIDPAQNLQENWQRLEQHFDTLFTADVAGERAIEQLKQTILQLAVMGNLVPQNPNDEPASTLLKKIAAEKSRLIKEKIIKKEKPLPPISDDEKPFDLPVGWAVTYMQDITKIITCGMASTPKYHDTGRIFLSAKNVKPHRFMPEEHKFVDEETFRRITQNAFPEKGDILLTRVGAGIGEAAVVDIEIEFAFYVSLTLIKPFLNYLDSYYLLLWLNSPQGVKKSLDNIYGGGVSQGNLNVNQVRGFEIPIPPLEEQHRIVTKVNELMSLCDTLLERIQAAQTTQLKLTDAITQQALS